MEIGTAEAARTLCRFGKGPETQCANPGATLYILDLLRHDPSLRAGVAAVDSAVEFSLDHRVTRRPIGPCHWGIGRLFMQVEYPFLRYNLFYYVYVLSFFRVERPHRGLKCFSFCAEGEPSLLASARYREIGQNLSK